MLIRHMPAEHCPAWRVLHFWVESVPWLLQICQSSLVPFHIQYCQLNCLRRQEVLAFSGLMGLEARAANLDSVKADEANDAHRARLAKAVHTRERLLLHRHIQRRLQQEHIAGCRRAGTPSSSGSDE